MHSFSMPSPSPIQANNRANIYAILVVAKIIELAGIIDYFTDNRIARDTYYKGKQRVRLTNHVDIWTDVFQYIEEKHLELNIYWVPSHTETDPMKQITS